MKLNLLIFFLLGVSVSASGIRGFTPIKGSERRLAPTKPSERSKKDTRIELKAGRFVKCYGDRKNCRNFENYCINDDGTLLKLFRDDGGSTASKSTSPSKKRRLEKSTNIRFINVSVDDLDECVFLVERSGGGSSSSDSTTSSDKADRKPTTTKKREGTQAPKPPKTPRTLASKSTTDTTVILTSEGGVTDCSGKKCAKFLRACTDNNKTLKTLFDFRDKSSSSKKGRDRRLKNSGGNIKFYYYTVENADDCTLVRTVDSSSKGTSTKKSEKF